MQRLLVFLAIIVVAAAFSSVSTRSNVQRLSMSKEMVGASVEAGGKVYDPIGMLKLHTINSDVFPHPKWLRESELKHCRIAVSRKFFFNCLFLPCPVNLTPSVDAFIAY